MMTSRQQLDEKLEQDSYRLGQMDSSLLLLMKNALYPWFVIVPQTQETELYQLDRQQQSMLFEQINLISQFVTQTFDIEKLNVAAIGNVVSQMHVHIVGRRHDDRCWPGVVWGCEGFESYDDNKVSEIRQKLLAANLISA